MKTLIYYFQSPNDEGFIETSFEPTPLMSTYLVAFIVSDFDKLLPDSTFNVYSQVSLNYFSNMIKKLSHIIFKSI